MLWGLVDALDDGVILTDQDGVIVLANRRAGDMYGYLPGELIGQPVESLVPDGLRAAHISQRAGYAQHPTARPRAARVRLAGRRKDRSTFPVRVSLSPVPTATGRLILAVIRDVTEDLPHADLGDLARAAAAGQARRGRELLDRVAAACSTSASACRPRLSCSMTRPCSGSLMPCTACTTRSARSVPTCSPAATVMSRHSPARPTDPDKTTA